MIKILINSFIFCLILAKHTSAINFDIDARTAMNVYDAFQEFQYRNHSDPIY